MLNIILHDEVDTVDITVTKFEIVLDELVLDKEQKVMLLVIDDDDEVYHHAMLVIENECNEYLLLVIQLILDII